MSQPTDQSTAVFPAVSPAPVAVAPAPAPPAAAPAPLPAPPTNAELIARRDRLIEQFTLSQTELGGVFYEMAIRDHIRLDVLTKRAAALQRLDAELAQVEQELRGDDGPEAGNCPECGSRHTAHARFCSRCGYVLRPSGITPAAAPTNGAPAA